MNSHQLRVFLTVANHGSFSRAAEALYLTQSAVSQQIDVLEREHRVRLFERLPRRITLTDAGALLLPFAERIIRLLDDATHALEEVRDVTRGRLRIGASPTPATYLLPELLGGFRRVHPGVEVMLDVDISARVADAVAAGDIALAVVEGLVPDVRLATEVLFDDELVLVTPADFTAAGQTVTLEELAGMRYIAREARSLTRILIDERLRAHGITLNPVMELGHIEAIKRAVGAGLGVAFLSRISVADELVCERVQVWQIEGIDLHRPWYLLRRAEARPSPAAAAFLSFLKAQMTATEHPLSSTATATATPSSGAPEDQRLPAP